MTVKGDFLENGEPIESAVPETASLGQNKKSSRSEKTRNYKCANGEMPKESGSEPTLLSTAHRNVPYMSDPLNKRGASVYSHLSTPMSLREITSQNLQNPTKWGVRWNARWD
eukprot:1159608-Ditylum_brightwellii.AAC.1